jgi:hypothetical protein
MPDVVSVYQNPPNVVRVTSDNTVNVYHTGVISTGGGGGSVTDGDKGDITVTSGFWTIDSGAVDNTKLSTMAQSTIKGRASGAGTGAVTDLTVAQVATVLAGTASGTLAAGNDSRIVNAAPTTQTFYIGTTQVAINRASASLALTGITSIDGSAASATTATNSTNVGITNDTTTNATMYPTWVTATTGNLPEKTSSTKLTFNPSTGTLASTVFSGSGASLTSIPQSAVTSLSTDLTNRALLAGATFTGLVSTPASTTGTAGLRVPHGSAPTTPTNGDVWSTTVGLYARINGATVGPFGAGGGVGDMLKSDNLSGLTNYTTARSNLGLGTMAIETATNYQLVSAKGAASGYASLDAGTKIPIAQIPTGTIANTVSLGDHTHTVTIAGASDSAISAPVDRTPVVWDATSSKFVTSVSGATGYVRQSYIRSHSGSAMRFQDSSGNTQLYLNSAGISLFQNAEVSGSGVGVIGITNVTTAPSVNPTGGVVAYSDAGVLKVRQPDGVTVTVQQSVAQSAAAGGTASKVFVGNTDPAASAAAGDIWIQAVL